MLIQHEEYTVSTLTKSSNVNKTCEIISLTRISTVESMLENAGSEVRAPQKPAYIIK